jgi:hypothetical protein
MVGLPTTRSTVNASRTGAKQKMTRVVHTGGSGRGMGGTNIIVAERRKYSATLGTRPGCKWA